MGFTQILQLYTSKGDFDVMIEIVPTMATMINMSIKYYTYHIGMSNVCKSVTRQCERHYYYRSIVIISFFIYFFCVFFFFPHITYIRSESDKKIIGRYDRRLEYLGYEGGNGYN